MSCSLSVVRFISFLLESKSLHYWFSSALTCTPCTNAQQLQYHLRNRLRMACFQTEANTPAQRRKYRSGQFRNADHNCSQEMSAIPVRGIRSHPEGNIRGNAAEVTPTKTLLPIDLRHRPELLVKRQPFGCVQPELWPFQAQTACWSLPESDNPSQPASSLIRRNGDNVLPLTSRTSNNSSVACQRLPAEQLT